MENNRETGPLLLLGATPTPKVLINNFFVEEGNPFFELLRNPPHLRYSGWNLLTLDYPKIKGGNAWEVTNGDRKKIRLIEDATLIALSDAGSDFLGWGRNEDTWEEIPLLNSLAVTEYIYEFVNVYKAILSEIKESSFETVTFRMELSSTTLSNGKKLRISPSEIFAPFYSLDAKEVEGDFSEDIIIHLTDYDSKYVAFLLLEKFYRRFSISIDKIHYVKIDDSGKRYVDIDSITKR